MLALELQLLLVLQPTVALGRGLRGLPRYRLSLKLQLKLWLPRLLLLRALPLLLLLLRLLLLLLLLRLRLLLLRLLLLLLRLLLLLQGV